MIKVFKRRPKAMIPLGVVAALMNDKAYRKLSVLIDTAFRLNLGPEIRHAMFAGVTL